MRARWLALIALLLCGCASTHSRAREISAEAEAALVAGEEALEREDPSARSELERATRLAPDWIAPERLLDELARRELRLPEALAIRRAQSDSAEALYLRGRLEGEGGLRCYQRALELDPECAFALHGLGVLAARAGRPAQAEQLAQRALRHAGCAWERGFFGTALARATLRQRGPRAGVQEIGRLLEEQQLLSRDVLRLRTLALQWRALLEAPEKLIDPLLELLREPELAEPELRALAALFELMPSAREELLLALTTPQPPPAMRAVRERLRAELLLQAAPAFLTAARLQDSSRLARWMLFAIGRADEAVERWLLELPEQVLAAPGVPKDARLARMVVLARAGSDRELGQALLECGWFTEARALAQFLALKDPQGAVALDDAALERNAELSQCLRVARDAEGLDAALRALRCEESPRLKFGPLGQLAHPGPWFSAEDEREGLGKAGEPVGGLARRMDRLGRFALLGEVLIQSGLDAAILPRVAVEQLSGSVLGQPWSGTVVWCEGQELAPRASRQGAHIHAAALHEGFWLDIASVRREREEWLEVERRFADPERRQRALAVEALPAEGAPADLRATLDASDRLRLAVIAERGVPSLSEFVQATAAHESAHIVDRQRFLPLERGWWRALRLLADCGFSLRMFGEELEARAQLAGLCESREPRILLAHLLDAAGGEFGKQLPHASGYRRLLVRLLKKLEGHPALDSSRLLVQQLHRLPAEELRRVARVLASEQGLDRP